jgi:ribonuclease BN (tRNA processing enzyme)
MRLEFLGTGGFYPNERRHTACLLLPEVGVQFDAGSSVFRVAERLETDELDIFLTHAHLDHVVGLPVLLIPLLQGAVGTARVHATPAVLAAVQEHLFDEAMFPLLPKFEWVELQPETSITDGGVVRHVPMKHPSLGSTGFRIDWPDRSMAYITDTTVDGTYTDFIRNVDLLVHECYFPDEMSEWSEKTGHSNTTPVAQLARDAQVGRLLLIHFDPQRPDDDPIGIDVARNIFPKTEIAEDGMVVE